MSNRSTKAAVIRRVEEVYRLRLSGAALPDIRDYAQKQEPPWAVSDAQLNRYIDKADALMRERFDAKTPHLLARHLLQRNQLFAHAVAAGDFRTALSVLQDEAELEGLYPAKKVAPTDPTGEKPYAITLSPADRAAAALALLAAVGLADLGPAALQHALAAGSVVGDAGADPHRVGPDAGRLANGAPAPPGRQDFDAL